MADKNRKQKLDKHKFQTFKHKKSFQNQKGKKDEGNDRWKNKVFNDFKKLKRKEQVGGVDVQKLYKEMQPQTSQSDEESQSTSAPQVSPAKKKFEQKKQASRFSQAQWEHDKKAETKRQKYEEMTKRKQEKEEALQRYRTKKKDRFLKLCKRTSKGQPVMKHQMHFLLEKLEKQHKEQTQASTSSS
ncbi:thyroid transcription factor 1-associated protein 26 homolog [Littorina saxatilis]|uniref:Thyroid transcription factor 1-associated protein 26 n=1 Tax=Littorina saxatilis TaxID=31220 RepID=A0AAN9B4U2_9CAEN